MAITVRSNYSNIPADPVDSIRSPLVPTSCSNISLAMKHAGTQKCSTNVTQKFIQYIGSMDQ